jgi:hypothetical protein
MAYPTFWLWVLKTTKKSGQSWSRPDSNPGPSQYESRANQHTMIFHYLARKTHKRTVVVEGLKILLRIREVLGSNSAQRSAILTQFCGFPQSLQANAGIVC